MKISLILLFYLVISYYPLYSQENPFLPLVGKKYEDYHDALEENSNKLFFSYSLGRKLLLQQLEEASKIDKSGEWELIRESFVHNLRLYESRKGGFTPSEDYSTEDFVLDYLDMARRAEAKGFKHIQIWGIYYSGEAYRLYSQNYAMALKYHLKVLPLIENLTTKEFPLRPSIYLEIARMYYNFGDYEKAMIYYQLITEDPYIEDNYYCTLHTAWNELGLCYRNGLLDIDKSDECFKRILKLPIRDKTLTEVWEGIAEGNLGYNLFLAGKYDEALELFLSCIKKIDRPNDYTYVSARSMTVADIYLKKKNLSKAKYYIDLSIDYLNKAEYKSRNSDFYSVMSKYYAELGNLDLSFSYMDSAMIAINKKNDAYSGLILNHVERELYEAEKREKEEELRIEKMSRQTYQYIIGLVLLMFLVSSISTFFFHQLYLKKKEAYSELARRAEEWAGRDNLDSINNHSKNENIAGEVNNSFEENRRIVEAVHNLMVTKKIFTDNNLSMESLAEMLNVPRISLSKSINLITGKNFNQFVNDYRIKEAIRIISLSANADISMEELYKIVGFASRTPFYLAFKKITGLSPREYKNSLKF